MRLVVVAILLASFAASPSAQTRRRTPAKPAAKAAKAPKTIKAAPEVTCPSPLGTGVKTHLLFCDVLTGRDPEAGVIIKFPPHRGPVTLTFDLHNRHTYSEELVRAKLAFTRYTATIGVLTMDNTLITRAVVQSEFRNASDLVDRIVGGAGPGGVKAVAPTGTEPITVVVPEQEEAVSLLGEKVTVERVEGPPVSYTSPGRPIAVVSDIAIEYTPAPPPKKKPTRRR